MIVLVIHNGSEIEVENVQQLSTNGKFFRLLFEDGSVDHIHESSFVGAKNGTD